MLHNNCSGGHLGTECTLEKARARFYWPFMSSDVKLHCKSCDLCSAIRQPALAARAPMQIDRIEKAIDNMSKAKYLTTLDLAAGYWQVGLTNAARAKSAFVTPIGLYEWNVMIRM